MVARNPSCCDPDCVVRPGRCCDCICQTLRVILDVPYGNECCCTGVSMELDWDDEEQHFAGALVCNDIAIDLKYFFERDDEGCWFMLRSEALGLPEGYEQRWKVGEDVNCDDLETAADVDLSNAGGEYCPDGVLLTRCVETITPALCRTCDCLPDSLCVVVHLALCSRTCIGLVEWDEDGQQYMGEVVCENGGTYDVTFLLRPRGDYDEEHPCDDTCVIVLESSSLGISDEWQVLEPSPLDPLGRCISRYDIYEWEIGYGEDEIRISLRGAICDPDLHSCDCPNYDHDTLKVLFEDCPDPDIYDPCDDVYVTLQRNPTLLPCGVEAPYYAPCGYWWGELGNQCVTFGFLVYCDGDDFVYDFYTRNAGAGCFTFITTGALDVTCRHGGPIFAISGYCLPTCCDGTAALGARYPTLTLSTYDFCYLHLCGDPIRQCWLLAPYTLTFYAAGTIWPDGSIMDFDAWLSFCGHDGRELNCQLTCRDGCWYLNMSNFGNCYIEAYFTSVNCDPLDLEFLGEFWSESEGTQLCDPPLPTPGCCCPPDRHEFHVITITA